MKEIGVQAFAYCSSLRVVHLGSGLETVKPGAFYRDTLDVCTYNGSENAWKKVKVEENNEALEEICFDNTASAIGEGNTALMIGIGGAVVIALVAAVGLKKKKTAAK